MKRTALTTLAIAGLAFAAPLNAQENNGNRLIGSVNSDALAAIVTGLGHTIENRATEGAPRIIAVNGDGLRYVMRGAVCDAQNANCQSILMQVVYRGAEQVTDANLARANLLSSSVTAWVNRSNDSFGFSRYIVLVDGVTVANVQRNIEVLLAGHALSLRVARGQEQAAAN